MEKTLGWHFTAGYALRDGTALEAGRTYTVEPPLALCRRGLHYSVRALDALLYSPYGTPLVVSRVRIDGEHLDEGDKGCTAARTVLWCADATRAVQEFALAAAEGIEAALIAQGIAVLPEAAEARRVASEYLAGRASAHAAWASAHAARASADAARASAHAARASADAARASADAVRASADAAWASADAVWASADAARASAHAAHEIMLTTMLESLAP